MVETKDGNAGLAHLQPDANALLLRVEQLPVSPWQDLDSSLAVLGEGTREMAKPRTVMSEAVWGLCRDKRHRKKNPSAGRTFAECEVRKHQGE